MRLILLTVAALSTATPALAQQRQTCMPLDQMDARIASEFQETVAAGGISDDGTLVRLYLSDTGSFTVVKVTAQKLACVVDFGTSWQTKAETPAGEGL
jgi:hypothetical protein